MPAISIAALDLASYCNPTPAASSSGYCTESQVNSRFATVGIMAANPAFNCYSLGYYEFEEQQSTRATPTAGATTNGNPVQSATASASAPAQSVPPAPKRKAKPPQQPATPLQQLEAMRPPLYCIVMATIATCMCKTARSLWCILTVALTCMAATALLGDLATPVWLLRCATNAVSKGFITLLQYAHWREHERRPRRGRRPGARHPSMPLTRKCRAVRLSARGALLLLVLLCVMAAASTATPTGLTHLQLLTGNLAAWEFSRFQCRWFRRCC